MESNNETLFDGNIKLDTNGTTSGNSTFHFNKSFRIIIGWISVIILVGILVFNSLVIGLILSKKKKTRLSFFVGNLAIADFSLGILYLLPETIFSFFQVPWDKYYCYIFFVYFSMVPFYASTYAIVALAIDRLYAIIKPVSAASKGTRYRLGLCLLTWLVGFLAAIQYAATGYHKESSEHPPLCSYNFQGIHLKIVLYTDFLLLLIIPLVIITFCYSIIVVSIWKREKQGFVPTHLSNSGDIHQKSRNITQAKLKTIKLLFVVVFAYVVCWTPYFVGALLQHHRVVAPGSKTFMAFYALAPLNSLSNPLVFLLFNFQMFRQNPKMGRNMTMHSSMTRNTIMMKSIHRDSLNPILGGNNI